MKILLKSRWFSIQEEILILIPKKISCVGRKKKYFEKKILEKKTCNVKFSDLTQQEAPSEISMKLKKIGVPRIVNPNFVFPFFMNRLIYWNRNFNFWNNLFKRMGQNLNFEKVIWFFFMIYLEWIGNFLTEKIWYDRI